MEMIEEVDYDSVDLISPFTSTIVEECCGTVEIYPVTKVYTESVDLTDFFQASYFLEVK